MENEALRTLLDQHEKELQDHAGRITALEKWRTDSSVSTATIVAKLDMQTEKIDTLTKKIDAIEQKPTKRWETVITAIITGVISFVVGMLLTKG